MLALPTDQANQSPLAAEALERIEAIYAIETEIRGRLPDERAAVLQARAGPLLVVVANTPEEFLEVMKEGLAFMTRTVRELGIPVTD